MPRITRSALVPFSALQMFDLVNDVESYPEFVPGCFSTKILEQTQSKMKASVEVAKAGIRKTFVTQNTLVSGEKIEMTLLEGPFRHLQGGWTFTHLDVGACQIELSLDFEFENFLVEMAFGKIFQELTINMVDAFTKRAKDIYGQYNYAAC